MTSSHTNNGAAHLCCRWSQNCVFWWGFKVTYLRIYADSSGDYRTIVCTRNKTCLLKLITGRAQKNQTTEDSISLKQQISTALKNRKFLLFALSGFCTSMAYFVPYLMLPDLITSKGLVSLDVEIVFTVAGISSENNYFNYSHVIYLYSCSWIYNMFIILLNYKNPGKE